MVKLSSFLLDATYCQAISRKRKRKQKRRGMDCDLGADEDSIGIDKLSDDILINILSRLGLKEAARTSVLARRWKYLWTFAFRNLKFDDTADGTLTKRKKFKSWVNAVLKSYGRRRITSLIIRFSKIQRQLGPLSTGTCREIDCWIYFAIQKEVQRFELDFSPNGTYVFPDITKLLSISHDIKSPFRSLRSFRLVYIDIKDEVVQHFLASCPHLERLCIKASSVTRNLQVVDPPNLKILEITQCFGIQSLEISAVNLVSLKYEGRENSLLLKKIPNLSELTLGDHFCHSFIFEPEKHSSYSVQLVKLVLNLSLDTAVNAPAALPQLCSLKRLELQVSSVVGRSLLFFTSLIKASPQLCEFRIEILYIALYDDMIIRLISFPVVSEAEAVNFDHGNLEVVEMAGHIGCSSEEKFLLQLFKIAPSVKRVVIDTESDYYDDPGLAMLLSFKLDWLETGATTRIESKERAQHLVSTFPQEIEFVVK